MANYISKHTGQQIDAAVDAYLAGAGTGGSVVVDATLTQQGAAADAKATGEKIAALSAEIAAQATDKIDKNQGESNVGKILMVGTDGNLFLTEMPESGVGNSDIVGVVDESNNIILMGALPNGTYTLKYEMADGSTAEVGSIVVQTIVPEPEPEPESNILKIYTVQINRKYSHSNESYKTAGGFISFELPFAEIANKTIYMKGFTKGQVGEGGSRDSWYFYPDDKSSYYAFANVEDSSISNTSVWNSTDIVDEGNGVYSIAINSNTIKNFDKVTTAIINMTVAEREITTADTANLIMTIGKPIA